MGSWSLLLQKTMNTSSKIIVCFLICSLKAAPQSTRLQLQEFRSRGVANVPKEVGEDLLDLCFLINFRPTAEIDQHVKDRCRCVELRRKFNARWGGVGPDATDAELEAKFKDAVMLC